MTSTSYNPQEDPVLKDFISRLKHELGERLKGAILFGSRARGDADQDSDYDVIVLVDEPTSELEEIVSNVSYEMLDSHGELFVAIVESETRFREDRYEPLFINVRNEGKPLYE